MTADHALVVEPNLGRLRVAFVESDLSLGGGAVFVLDLATELSRRGIQCHVFSFSHVNSLAADFASRGIPVSYGGKHKASIYEDRLTCTLEALRDFGPNAVIVGANFEPCELLRYLPPGLQRILVFHVAVREHLNLAALYCAHFDHAVAVSSLVAEALREVIQREPSSLRCIELGVMRPLFNRRPSPAEAPIRILYLGRLEQEAKRVRLFPAILARLKAAGRPFLWTIAGDGSERAFLEANMTSEPDQQVIFRGLVPRGEIEVLLAEHDIFLLCSDTEAFSLGLHEAMAAGLVPVVSQIPGPVSEAVTPEIGFVVPLEHTDGYADAIIALQEDRADLARRSVAAQHGVQPRYSLEGMGDRWQRLLTEIPVNNIEWQHLPRVQPPLGTQPTWRFSPVGRFLRRWAARSTIFRRKPGK